MPTEGSPSERTAPGVPSWRTGLTRPVRIPVSRAQVEVVLARAAVVYLVLYVAQTLPTFLDQADAAHPAWSSVVGALLIAALVAAATAAILRSPRVRVALAAFALVHLLAVLTWPLAVVRPASDPTTESWLYALLTAAMVAAAVSLPAVVAAVAVFVMPVVYGLVRLTPAGGSARPEQSVLDAVVSIIVGATVLIVVAMVRAAASAVDGAQTTALARYAHAVRQHATEVERVQVDAIVHDSVLTTLLSAARADTPGAKALATAMASEAIDRLRDAALVVPDDGSTMTASAVSRRITGAAAAFGDRFAVSTRTAGGVTLPVHAAEAVHSAAVQAMVNSLQHAGETDAVRRWVRIRARDGALTVAVGDSGRGFDPTRVPRERLGLRVSIVERVVTVGGQVDVEAAPGRGAVVSIRWPADDASDAHTDTDTDADAAPHATREDAALPVGAGENGPAESAP